MKEFTDKMRRLRSMFFGMLLNILLLVIYVRYTAPDDIDIQKTKNTFIISEFEGDKLSLGKQQPSTLIPLTDRKIKKNEDFAIVEDLQSFYKSQSTQFSADPLQTQPYVPPHRLVHIDFKGAPPTLPYLQKLFQLIKRFGGTGILTEWEDMFPWSLDLYPMAAINAYSKTDIREILKMAEANKLEVIPLIQTFGHVEFALKLTDFAHLREIQDSPQSLCPSYNASVMFVKQMIHQVLEIHGNVRYIHIGCDEVYHIGQCFRCKDKTRKDLFLSHVKTIASYVRTKSPSTVAIIWDDMLRNIPVATMQMYDIGKFVEPMIWEYADDVNRFVSQGILKKYQIIFSHAWVASAFKGASGETAYIPNVKRHLKNNLSWLKLMSNENSHFKGEFRGIAITGWQRYNHFAVLCEILPSSIPSMVVNLLATTKGYMNYTLQSTLNEGLNCGIFRHNNDYDEDFLDLNNDPYLWGKFSSCNFPGNQFFRLLNRLHIIEIDYKKFVWMIRNSRYMTRYNIEHKLFSPNSIDELMKDHSRIYQSILSMIRPFQKSMTGIFDNYTISEWIEQRVYPMTRELERIQKEAYDPGLGVTLVGGARVLKHSPWLVMTILCLI